jgi:hypothetical protein
MSNLIKIIALFALLASAVEAQSLTQIFTGPKTNSWLIDPVYLPTVATDLLVADTFVCVLQVTNEGADTTITITDKQTTPVALLAGPTISSKQTWFVININPATGPCRKFKGGIRASAGTANVSIYMSGVQ